MPVRGQAQTRTPPPYRGLPEELSEFLGRDTYSLLIKGESGTGKTILALSILTFLAPIENLLYISTRTSPLQLVENYPWLEEVFGPPDTGVSEGWDTLVDARLDEPNVVFERITNVLMDREAPTVVIDSWESLGDSLGSDALRTNIKVLQTWRERAGAKFIFVGEDPTSTAIDFMVEGVVVLKDSVEDGGRFREIVLSKLHGVRIPRPSYFFTLQGGRFTSIPAYSPRDYEFRSPLPVSFDKPFRRVKSKVPTGYGSLDSHLEGGIPLHQETVVEVDDVVDPRVALVFLSRTVQGWLAEGGRVVVQRPKGVDNRFLGQYSRSFAAGGGAIQLSEHGGTVKDALGEKSGRRKLLAVAVGDPGTVPGRSPSDADLVVRLRSGKNEPRADVRSSDHLRIVNEGGTLFVKCDLPLPATFGVFPEMSGGNPMLRLQPIV